MFNIIEFLYLHQKNNLVYYDSLTGTRSRMYYDRVIARKYQDKSVKIIYIDINNLKKMTRKVMIMVIGMLKILLMNYQKSKHLMNYAEWVETSL